MLTVIIKHNIFSAHSTLHHSTLLSLLCLLCSLYSTLLCFTYSTLLALLCSTLSSTLCCLPQLLYTHLPYSPLLCSTLPYPVLLYSTSLPTLLCSALNLLCSTQNFLRSLWPNACALNPKHVPRIFPPRPFQIPTPATTPHQTSPTRP